jgi:hypothetical protein
MKTMNPTITNCLAALDKPNAASFWRKLFVAAAALLLAGILSPSAQAQTTIKPFQIRVEVPIGFAGQIVLSNNVMKVATNGASVLDSTGTNWVINPVNLSITGAPAGVTATLTDSSLNPVTTVPINMNINNASTSTNLFVQLTFNGAQASGTSTLSINAIGALTNDNVNFVLEVGSIWNGAANAVGNGAGKWSDSSQWLGGVPTAGANVVFTDLGTQTNLLYYTPISTNLLVNSIVDANIVISSLRFSQTNGLGTPLTNYHNLLINPGVTLAIAGNDGFKMLRDSLVSGLVFAVSDFTIVKTG